MASFTSMMEGWEALRNGGGVVSPLQTMGVITSEWELNFIINCYKKTGNF